jgi:hypothetical protein
MPPLIVVGIVVLTLFIVGITMEKLHKRKLEIDLQKKLEHTAEK